MNDMTIKLTSTCVQELNETFQLQRKASRELPPSTLKERLAHLNQIKKLLIENESELCNAISLDFGSRSRHESKMFEIDSLISNIAFIRKNLKKWVKPQKRKVGILFAGGKNTVIPQPKGVIGIITPWNYPLFLAFAPCADALAAGNRCIIKMSENSKNLAGLLQRLVPQYFDKSHLHLIADIEPTSFPDLPWDHLVFTGSTSTGRKVMAAAAKHLTPVTLELGGKSPAIIDEDFSIKTAVERVMFGKLANAGQTCIAPDYLFVPRSKLDAFVETAKSVVANRYPNVKNQDFTSIIDEKSYLRLQETIENAVRNGAKVIPLIKGDSNDEKRKLTPQLILGCTNDMTILQREIFGPLLPIIPYDDLESVITEINTRERPLALYIFSNNTSTQTKLLKRIISGGATINDCLFHIAQHDLPFGGIGNSGMGHYHGFDGFKEFSKMRPVFEQGPISPVSLMSPPFGRGIEAISYWMKKLDL